MEPHIHPGLDPLQRWAVEKFHFSAIFSGAPPADTPLALLANGQGGENILGDPEILELARPLGLTPSWLRSHLIAAYRTIEG